MVTLTIILIGLKLPKRVEHSEDLTDLQRKLMELAERKIKVKMPKGIHLMGYTLETDEWQRLLTHCFRVRISTGRTFIDVCDDYFTGFHTYSFDMEGRAAGDQFNAYGPEPTVESECPSDLPAGETIVRQDQLNEFR